MKFLATVDPAPPGFERVELGKRYLLAGPVAVVVSGLAAIDAVLPDFRQRMRGIVLVFSTDFSYQRLGSHVWLACVPPSWLPTLREVCAAWLDTANVSAQYDSERNSLTQTNERLRRELETMREDYNRVTGRLQQQLRELSAAEAELREKQARILAMNEELEARVQQRTSELQASNEELELALLTLQRAQNELIQSEKLAALGALVAGMAHELNTPIGNAVITASSLDERAGILRQRVIEGGLRRSEFEAFLTTVAEANDLLQRNLHKASELVTHFKQLAVDQTSDRRRTFDLAAVIEDVVISQQPQIKKTPYTLELSVVSGVVMDSYPGALGQVLANLIDNALLHAFDGRSDGRMTLSARPQSDNWVQIEFRDNGVGIGPNLLPRIFDPFYTSKLGHGGSGLGLFICYKLVSQVMGGHIDAASQPGAGTSFLIALPNVAPVREGEISMALRHPLMRSN